MQESMMTKKQLPWSFYAILISFAIFFGSLNIYIVAKWLNHPFSSELWLIGVIIGFVALLYSIRVMRIHQRELIIQKEEAKREYT